MVFAGNFMVFDFVFFGIFFLAFSWYNYVKIRKLGTKGHIASRKRTDNFSVRRILLFLAHLKSPVPATVGKSFASVYIPTQG